MILRERITTKMIIPVVAILLCFVCAAGAVESRDVAGENAELKQRIEQLDRELADLKRDMMGQDQATDSPAAQKSIWSSLDIQLYGFLKLDAAYDTSQTEVGNFAIWVDNESLNDDDNQFNMTARQSQFGAIISGPDGGSMKASGRVEVDFYEGGAENRNRLMMRHAYMKMDWPDSRFSILAGQTWDVISPLRPTTVNYSICWFTGNLGYRRPQLRLTKEIDLDSGETLKLEGAFTRTIGRLSFAGGQVVDSGDDSGVPSLQGRVSTELDLFTGTPSAIGVSGHIGREEYDTSATGTNENFRSWSLNLDLVQPVYHWLSIKSELFTGENLDAYLGGIGQGVTLTGPNTFDEVGSSGGWIAAAMGPWKKAQFNVGLALDDVDRSDVDDGDRTFNRSIFANMFYAINKNIDLAAELSHWETDYRGPGDADSFRIQGALIYKF